MLLFKFNLISGFANWFTHSIVINVHSSDLLLTLIATNLYKPESNIDTIVISSDTFIIVSVNFFQKIIKKIKTEIRLNGRIIHKRFLIRQSMISRQSLTVQMGSDKWNCQMG